MLDKFEDVEELVDAMICDSFWFIVTFFQYNTKLKSSTESSEYILKKLNDTKCGNEDLLKRIAFNFFQFFIKICEIEQKSKEHKDRIKGIFNKDPIQRNFYDFVAQCVFYSIYLAFPKSRHIFNNEFKNTIACIFAYLFNGLTLNKYAIDHWDLDLGTGNIIENPNNQKNFAKDDDDKEALILPTIQDIQKFEIFNIRENRHKKGKSVSDATSLRTDKLKDPKEKEKDKDILNTPLYRLYAEYKSFETLNMIKPVLMKKRKYVYTEK